MMIADRGMTVVDAMVTCGLHHDHFVMDKTQAHCFINNIFDDLLTCLDITFKDLDKHFKTYSDLILVAQAHIKAFVQWTCDELRLGRDPSASLFPIELVGDLVCHYKTHEKFIASSKTLSEDAKPDKSKETTKWEDCKPTFTNYLRLILPECDGMIPLKYICLENDTAEPLVASNDFLDDYAASQCTTRWRLIGHAHGPSPHIPLKFRIWI